MENFLGLNIREFLGLTKNMNFTLDKDWHVLLQALWMQSGFHFWCHTHILIK